MIELAHDIRQNGLRQPIIIDRQDRVIDGRNREAACELAGVDPLYEPFVGTEAEILQLVVSLNVHRRHLTESQRAMIAAEVANRKNGQRGTSKEKAPPIGGASNESVSIAEAASALNVGERSVERARKVKDKGTPELQDAVTSGKVSVSRAAKVADLPGQSGRSPVSAGVSVVPVCPFSGFPYTPKKIPQLSEGSATR